jgi:hypothetical protein
MNEVFIIEKGIGNFVVKLNHNRIWGAAHIETYWDKEDDAVRACILANQAFELAKKCHNLNH